MFIFCFWYIIPSWPEALTASLYFCESSFLVTVRTPFHNNFGSKFGLWYFINFWFVIIEFVVQWRFHSFTIPSSKILKGKATRRSVFSSLYSCAPTHHVNYIFQTCDGQDLGRRVNKDKIHATHVCTYASVPPGHPGWLYFGSCPEGQISSRTNVPSTFQNKQPVIHRCQLTLNFLSIATTTTICHHDTAHRAPTPSKHTHAGTSACMRAHRRTHKIRYYLISQLILNWSHALQIRMHTQTHSQVYK